jgi:large subunit ribosomal protein L25
VVRDSQYHPVTEAIEHVDFFQLTDGEPVQVVAPINLVGNPRGVRNGGRLKFNLRRLTIRATEENLPGMIDLDVENLKIGESLRVSDIPVSGFEVVGDPSRSVVGIQTSRNMIADDEDEEGAEDEEGTEEGAEETAEA